MNVTHREFFDSAAETILQALGPNVVRFMPPARDESGLPAFVLTEALGIVDQAAETLSTTRRRATEAEELAQRVSDMAIRELKSAKLRLDLAEASKSQTADELRLAKEEAARCKAQARDAEERAKKAESRTQAAEARAKRSEEGLERLTE